MDNEIFRDVQGYEGLYQVSNKGRVFSVEREYIGGGGAKCKTGGKILKPYVNQHRGNRVAVILCKDGKTKTKFVSILVAQAFPEICGEWYEGCDVDHRDTDTQNNNAENLKVCNRKENMANPITKERMRDYWDSERSVSRREESSERMKGDNNPARRCMNDEWRKHLSERMKGRENPKCRKRVKLFKEGEEMEFESLTKAAEFIGTRVSDVRLVITGRQNTVKGWRAEYA